MDADELKRRSRGTSQDMSAAAISRRLDIVSQLYEVWCLLRTARRVGSEPSFGVAEDSSLDDRGLDREGDERD